MNDTLHTTVVAKVLGRFSKDGASRTEALRDVLLLQDQSPERAERMARAIPELPAALRCKWATLFADKLIATVPREQIEDLCLPDAKNEAALAMVFLLFLESERMERQMEWDTALWRDKGIVSQDVVENAHPLNDGQECS